MSCRRGCAFPATMSWFIVVWMLCTQYAPHNATQHSVDGVLILIPSLTRPGPEQTQAHLSGSFVQVWTETTRTIICCHAGGTGGRMSHSWISVRVVVRAVDVEKEASVLVRSSNDPGYNGLKKGWSIFIEPYPM